MGKWRCTVCGYIYDEEKGEPVTGTPAGTKFEDLPEKWRCPICGASKEAFVREAETDIHAEAETTVAEVIISELEKWGVEFCSRAPGDLVARHYRGHQERPLDTLYRCEARSKCRICRLSL